MVSPLFENMTVVACCFALHAVVLCLSFKKGTWYSLKRMNQLSSILLRGWSEDRLWFLRRQQEDYPETSWLQERCSGNILLFLGKEKYGVFSAIHCDCALPREFMSGTCASRCDIIIIWCLWPLDELCEKRLRSNEAQDSPVRLSMLVCNDEDMGEPINMTEKKGWLNSWEWLDRQFRELVNAGRWFNQIKGRKIASLTLQKSRPQLILQQTLTA